MGEGYNKEKVVVPIVAMKGGTDHQTYVDILVPGPAKFSLFKGEGPIHLVGSHCVDFYGYRATGAGDESQEDIETEDEAIDEKEAKDLEKDQKEGKEVKGAGDKTSPSKEDSKKAIPSKEDSKKRKASEEPKSEEKKRPKSSD